MKFNEAEAVLVEALHREFAFLRRDHGFVEGEPSWDGHALRIKHTHPRLEVENQLEVDLYLTSVRPLIDGRRPELFDQEGDERFVSFELEDIRGLDDRVPEEALRRTFQDWQSLEKAVAARASVLRPHIPGLLKDGGTLLRRIASRKRASMLMELVPQWGRFVDRVRDGFDGGIAQYVAGVNLRGQIQSVLKWADDPVPEVERELQLADAEFDGLTVQMRYLNRPGLYPHERARRWWRIPEALKGPLKGYFFPATE